MRFIPIAKHESESTYISIDNTRIYILVEVSIHIALISQRVGKGGYQMRKTAPYFVEKSIYLNNIS